MRCSWGPYLPKSFHLKIYNVPFSFFMAPLNLSLCLRVDFSYQTQNLRYMLSRKSLEEFKPTKKKNVSVRIKVTAIEKEYSIFYI